MEGPSEINTERAPHLVKVHKGKLSFQYNGKGNHSNDVGTVIANRPFATNELIGYYEIRINSAGQRGNIALGLTNQDFNVTHHPGKDSESYGYQGDDGRKYEDNQGSSYGPKFGTDDIVGCGLHFGTREIFFTKNAQHLGVAFRGILNAHCPAVGLHSEGEAVTFNFGAESFMFPIATLIREEEAKFSSSISKLYVEGSVLHELVRQYLLHHGFVGTLESLNTVSENKLGEHMAREGTENAVSRCQATCLRIRKLLEQGDAAGAIVTVETAFPCFLKDCRLAQAILCCQIMVEHLSRGDLCGAVAYAREALAPLLFGPAEDLESGGQAAKWHAEGLTYIRNAMTLVAICQPLPRVSGPGTHAEGDVAGAALEIPSEYHGRAVASKLTVLLRGYVGEEDGSGLERLMHQLMATHASLGLLQGGRREALTLAGALRLKRLV